MKPFDFLSFLKGLGIGLAIACMFFYALIVVIAGYETDIKNMRRQAVENDAAIWLTDTSGNTKFEWKNAKAEEL